MNKIQRLYSDLKNKHGRPQGQWSFWCRRPKTERAKEQVIIEAILTQRTNWKNVELTMANLHKAKADSLAGIYKLGNKSKLAPLIKSSGFYKQKAGYLFDLAMWVVEECGGLKEIEKEPVEKLREKLLARKGIGPETADSILLYALEKPVFVIDEYTRRLLAARGISRERNYDKLLESFEKNLPRNWRLYQDFHALIVIDGKNKRLGRLKRFA